MNPTVAQMHTYTRKGNGALELPLLRNVLPARWRVAAAIVCRARREAGHRVTQILRMNLPAGAGT